MTVHWMKLDLFVSAVDEDGAEDWALMVGYTWQPGQQANFYGPGYCAEIEVKHYQVDLPGGKTVSLPGRPFELETERTIEEYILENHERINE